jgi:hypothetical protein
MGLFYAMAMVVVSVAVNVCAYVVNPSDVDKTIHLWLNPEYQ